MTVYSSNRLLITNLNQKKTHMKTIKNETLERNENWVMNEFAKRFDVNPMQIIEQNKSAHICSIRHLYCKLRHDKHGISYSATGREIGRCHSTVKYAVTRINKLLLVNNKRMIAMWNKVRDISESYL